MPINKSSHLKIAGDFTTDSFILSLRRFMRSDNGTNFVRDSTELKQSIKALDQVSIKKHLVAKNIDWKFNPPLSPWMRGIWESLVKSIKRC